MSEEPVLHQGSRDGVPGILEQAFVQLTYSAAFRHVRHEGDGFRLCFHEDSPCTGDQGSGSGLVVGVSTHFQRLAMCVQQSQLVSMMAFAKQVHVWRQRGAYATLRPAGWRSQPDSKTSPRCVRLA